MSNKDLSSTDEFERALEAQKKEHYLLRLYISGMTIASINAVNNLKKICEETIPGRYTLEVIDVRSNPELAKEANVLAAPTLVKKLPLPLRKLIGDMSKAERVLVGLDVVEKGKDRKQVG